MKPYTTDYSATGRKTEDLDVMPENVDKIYIIILYNRRIKIHEVVEDVNRMSFRETKLAVRPIDIVTPELVEKSTECY